MNFTQTEVHGIIQTLIVREDENEREFSSQIIDDKLIMPNTIVWNGQIMLVNQVVLDKNLFREMYEKWIVESEDASND